MWCADRTVRVCAVLAAVGWTVGASAAPVIDVADFEGPARTAQGGWFHCFGAKPDRLADRLVTLGEPPSGAWRVDVANGAPAEGVGAVLPLFDQREGVAPRPLDVSTCPNVQLRLLGRLGQRRLRVEVVSGPVLAPERRGARLTTLDAAQLDEQRWSTHVWPLPTEDVDRTQVGALRFWLEGEGAAWIAVDAVRFQAADAPAADAPVQCAKTHPLRQAIWVWETAQALTEAAERDRLVAFCTRHGLTDVFLQIPYEYDGGRVRLRLVDEQRALNTAAARAGITVHALDGSPRYVLAANHPRMLALVDALAEFNRDGPTEGRYRAVHLDNEPYVLDEWRDPAAQPKVIADFVALNRALRPRANAADMQYGIDIPFWFDATEASGQPKFVVQTEAGPVPLLEALFPHVQNVGIMSYRERVTGPNGVVACCATEFALGVRFNVEVLASVELGTGPKVEKGITFGVYPLAYFDGQLDTLRRALACEKGAAGLAIHYYEHYRKWEEQP